MPKKIRTYSTEFKTEAVKKTAENNGNISVAVEQLGISMQTLFNWKNKAKFCSPVLSAYITQANQRKNQQSCL